MTSFGRTPAGRVAAAAALSLLLQPAAAQFPPQPNETLPGFKPRQTYESSPSDSVNLYSGDLNLAIPLGPTYSLGAGLDWQLAAHYSAKLWKMETVACSGPLDSCGKPPSTGRAYASGYPTLGVGWTLHLGIVSMPPGSLPAMYYTPDGAGHEINRAGGPTGEDTNFNVQQSGAYWVVYKPDGTQYWHGQLFTPPPSQNGFDLESRESPGDKYGLSYIKDRFGNTVLEVFYQPSPNAWKIDHIVLNGDAINRKIQFTWGTYTGGDMHVWPVLQNINFPVLSSPPTTLDAAFTRMPSMAIRRGEFDSGHSSNCADGGPALPDLPFLGSITQSAEVYSFDYVRGNDPNHAPGVLKQMVLPTSGVVTYDYARSSPGVPCFGSNCSNPETNTERGIPPDDTGTNLGTGFSPCDDANYLTAYLDTTPSVITRTETDPVTSLVSQVTYARDAVANKNYPTDTYPSPHRVARRVVVTRQNGNGGTIATKYIFRNGYEVSRRYYADLNTAGAPIRSEEHCYERASGTQEPPALCGVMELDPITHTVLIGDDSVVDFFRQSRSLTWYGPNPIPGGDCFALSAILPCTQRENSSYDANAREYQVNTVKPNSYLNSMAGFSNRKTTTTWAPDLTAWILKLFNARTVEDDATVPAPTSTTTNFRFASGSGFLKDATITDPTYGTLKRSYVDASDNPIKDGYGNPTQEKASGTGTIAATAFSTTRGFSFGNLSSASRNGLTPSWKSYDVDRDIASGLTTVSRDPNGTATGYGYDSLSRLTSVAPLGEATTGISYDPSNRQVTVTRTGADDSTREIYLYDGFGRTIREIRQMPTGFAVRKRTYNPAGLLDTESEWDACTSETADCMAANPPQTTFSGFDPFGRATVITRPDSTVTTVSYTDSFKIGSNVQYYSHSDTLESTTVTVSGVSATTALRRDVLGRIIEVIEPHISGDSSGDKTRYKYNVLDKLAAVEHWNAAETQITQSRSFTYDGFGFLRSESHPEKGTVTYSGFDALGNPGAKAEGGTNYSYTYDPAGRLLGISVGSTRYIRNCYDGLFWSNPNSACQTTTIVGKPLGKLADRVGFNPGAADNRIFVDRLTYNDTPGRLTQQSLVLRDSSWTNDITHLTQNFAYTSLGQVKTHDHSFRDSGTTLDPPDRFRVTTTYSHGYPTSVIANGQSVIASAAYHPYGGLRQYTLGDGVVVNEGIAPSKMPRVDSILSTGATVNVSTGTYGYDGAGNITSIGTSPTQNTFSYDPRSRLTSSSVFELGSSKTDSVTYDRFGNIIARVQDGGSIGLDTSTATNRLCVMVGMSCTAQFDPHGNLSSYGGKTHTYDDLSRQTSFQLGSSLEKYLYDGRNERIARIVPTASLPQPPVGLKFFPLTPCRLLDTRAAAGPYGAPRIPANGSRPFLAWGQCGIPSTAVALAGNVTSVSATGQGQFRAYPKASLHPVINSNVFKVGYTRATQAMVGLDTQGYLSIEADQATADALLDVSGYFAPATTQMPPSGDTYFFTARDPQNRLSSEYSATAPSTASTYAPTADYVYLGNRLVASYVATRIPSRWLYFVTDHLGSPRLVADQGGNTVGRYTYRPFGMAASDEAAPQGAAFAGMEKDAASSNYSDHARYFAAPILRFNSPDLLGGRVEDPQSWNRYAYARNNPLKYVDLDGNAVRLSGEAAQALVEYQNQKRAFDALVNPQTLRANWADGNYWFEVATAATNAFLSDPTLAMVPSAMAIEVPTGEFSVIRWTGYPESVPRPSGPFRILQGLEQQAARGAADNANRAIHAADPSLAGMHIHEIQPIKFGGSPSNPANKLVLSPGEHQKVSSWWSSFLKNLKEFVNEPTR